VAANIRFINPEGLVRSPAYTQVVEVAAPGRTVYISGQLGTAPDGKLAGRDFRAQAEQVFENLATALASVGAGFFDIVKIGSYLADIAHLPILREVRALHLNPTSPPVSTTIAVSGFALPGALLEIEAIAVVPGPGVRQRRPSAKLAAGARAVGASAAEAVKAVRRKGK
jgi:enamine deaminase RidA (YjgF/YER057c/UK114 family)